MMTHARTKRLVLRIVLNDVGPIVARGEFHALTRAKEAEMLVTIQRAPTHATQGLVFRLPKLDRHF